MGGGHFSPYYSIQGPGQCVIHKNTPKIGAAIMTQTGPGWRGWGGGGGKSQVMSE